MKMLLKTFDDIAQVDDALFSAWMERVDPRTLCIALHGASETLRERIMNHLSRFAKKLLEEEMSLIPRLSHDVIAQAQQELLELALCINDGEEAVPRQQERTSRGGTTDRGQIDLESLEALAETLFRLAQKAQKHGLLALEEDLDRIDDSILRDGLEYAIAGVDSDFVKDVIHTRLTYLEEEYRRWRRRKVAQVRERLRRSIRKRAEKVDKEVLRGEMIVEALLSIREGENPLLLRERLRAFLPKSWQRNSPRQTDGNRRR